MQSAWRLSLLVIRFQHSTDELVHDCSKLKIQFRANYNVDDQVCIDLWNNFQWSQLKISIKTFHCFKSQVLITFFSEQWALWHRHALKHSKYYNFIERFFFFHPTQTIFSLYKRLTLFISTELHVFIQRVQNKHLFTWHSTQGKNIPIKQLPLLPFLYFG